MPFLAPVATTGFLASGAAGGASIAAASSTASLLGTLTTAYKALQPAMMLMSAVSPLIAMGSASALASQQIGLANQQASLTEYEIKNIEDAAALRSSRRRKLFRKAVGTQLSIYGASGVDVTQGTPVDVMADTAKEFAYEGFVDAFETQNKVYANTIRARNQRSYGWQQATGTLLDYGMRTMERGWMPKGNTIKSAIANMAFKGVN